MGIYDDFKKFLIGGNLVSMAVAFVVGLAIVALIGALVDDIIDPLIGAAGGVNFSGIGILTINGSNLLGGAFLGAIITFLILMVVVFFLIAYPYQKHQERVAKKAAAAPATTRTCPECLATIPIPAKRCYLCTAEVPPVVPAPALATTKS